MLSLTRKKSVPEDGSLLIEIRVEIFSQWFGVWKQTIVHSLYKRFHKVEDIYIFPFIFFSQILVVFHPKWLKFHSIT